jgi:hypothetical protein
MRRLKILKIYFVLWIFLFFLVYSNFDTASTFFLATVTFNIAIITVLSIGLIIIISAAFQLTMLTGTFAILRYKKGDELEFYLRGIDKVFPQNIANMFQNRARKKVLFFTKQEFDDIAQWLEDKFSNIKTYITFFTGTVLMIGLLGTFTGLLQAIDEMGSIILGLSGDINLAEVIAGFAEPLSGMAVGFASSLFGVASAIILSIMGYILNRNEAIFLEDVYDWMKGQIVESHNLSQNNSASGGDASSNSTSGGMMDLFVDNISALSDQMEKYNKSNEAMFGMLSDSIDNGNETTQKQMAVLENISTGLKELNINQFSNANIMEESLQEVSGAIMNENKTVKKLLDLQEQNNEMLSVLIKHLHTKDEIKSGNTNK